MSQNRTHHALPPELAPTARAMDRLARAEADGAPPDLETALGAATRPTLLGARRLARSRSVVGTLGHRTAMPLAASIGLVATIGLTWLALTGPPAPTGDARAMMLETDLDLLLTITADDSGVRDEFDLLLADTATIGAELDSAPEPWTPPDDGGSL